MQLSEALRLVRWIASEVMKHRDHICSEVASHDLAHCPKILSQIYAWRVESKRSNETYQRSEGRAHSISIESCRTSWRGKYLQEADDLNG